MMFWMLSASKLFHVLSNCVAPLPCRPYPAALAFYRNFKVWGERVLLLGRPTSPLPPGNLPHDLEVSGGGGGG